MRMIQVYSGFFFIKYTGITNMVQNITVRNYSVETVLKSFLNYYFAKSLYTCNIFIPFFTPCDSHLSNLLCNL